MAKKPSHSSSSSRPPLRGGGTRGEDPAAPASSGQDDLESALTAEPPDLDGLESALTAGLSAGDLEVAPQGAGASEDDSTAASARMRHASAAPASAYDDTDPGAESDGAPAPPARAGAVALRGGKAVGFGPLEWAALGGFGVLALIAGVLFMRFLYAHPAPLMGAGLPTKFDLPLSGPAVRLSGVDAGWRDRDAQATARLEEKILPTVTLTLDAGHTSTGYVRVEFVDSEDRIRGDVIIVPIQDGRFQDSGRGERLADGGTAATVSGTVGFRTEALFASYFAGDEPRWSVRIKEGPDSSNGPWTELGAALIPNKKHQRP